MATTQDLTYRVTVNDSQLDRLIAKTASLNSALYTSSAALKPLDAQLRGMGRRTVEIGRYLTRNITTPLLLMAGGMAKLGYDFDKTFSRISSLVGASREEMARFEQQVYDLGKTTPTSVKELADALYFITSSGFAGASAMNILTASNKAAVAGLGDVKTVADTVTSVLNAYGKSAISAERATDVLLATVRVGKAEPGELASSIGRVIPLAKQLGVEFSEVGGAVAALTLQGLSADLAVTGLRATFTTFTKILKPTRDGLTALGLDAEKVQKSIGEQGLAKTMNEIRRRVDQFDTSGGKLAKNTLKAFKEGGEEGTKEFLKLQEQVGNTGSSILSDLFPNVRALTAFLSLTNKAGAETARVIGEVRDSMGETDTDFLRAMQQDWAKTGTAINRVRTQATQLGKELLPAVRKIASVVATLFEFFNALPKPVKTFVGLNVVLLGLLGPVLIALGQLIRLSSVRALGAVRNGRMITGAFGKEATAAKAVGGAAMLAGDEATAAAAQTVKGAELATAAYQREREAVILLTREERIRREAQYMQLRSAATGQFVAGRRVTQGPGSWPANMIVGDPRAARGAGVEQAGRRAGMTGPGGMPLFFNASSARQVVKMRGAMAGLSTAIRGVGTALAPIAAFVWPIALLEGAVLIIQYWDQIGVAVDNATDKLGDWISKANEAVPGGGFVDKTVKDAFGWLGKQGTPGKLLQFAITGPLGLAAKHGQDIKDEMVKSKEETAKAAAHAAELARNLELSQKRAGRLKLAAEKISEVFAQLVEDADRAFEAATDRMVANLRVTVQALGRSFSIGQEGLTPAERELAALDKVSRKRQLIEAIEDARDRLRQARAKKLVEVTVGNRIFGFVAKGDREEAKQARRDLRDANDDLKRYGLEERAKVERVAADKALDEAEKQLRARRELQQRHFDAELKALQEALAKGELTEKQARARMTTILKSYGVTLHQAGIDLGTAFATGLQESLNAVFAQFSKVRGAFLAIATAKEQATMAAPLIGTRGAGSLPEAGSHLYQNQQPATGPYGTVLPPGAGTPTVWIENLIVSSPQQAQLVANTIARKVKTR